MAGFIRGELAKDWEECNTIRSRFRREVSWIQWPTIDVGVPAAKDDDDDNGKDDCDDTSKRPASTQALELNAEALLAMVDYFNGNFIDIDRLQIEVPPITAL